jgi:hypothetical protein
MNCHETGGDVIPGSYYMEGMGWMKRPESEWPCLRSFGQAPAEEMQKDMVVMARHTIIARDK